ncbi:type VI secretion system secreted protein VgrG [Pseudoduganella flava]|uniref:Type VI secretion system secreted protein VgrG n=1 Tax=Pseudoduganella flava TaxID=871742 RepID=A0A562PCF5_9BURK|nr:type VI secretion system Vgr family protein [Pseudoduganella flava]QGZ40144.1 type VI secretion system tip protein VgrG [Pseudoduganella flava]TWI42094.1 type VI secretion system secreted protein VgrG [Pseudoduganella flava]
MGIVNAFVDFLVTHRDLVTENRPLRLRVDHPRMMMEDVLLPQRVQGVETLCGGFEYRVLCVALDAQLPLKEFIAQPAAIDIVTDRGKLRSVCGIVTEAWAGESDGGLASYQLVIRDALAVLDKRTNTRVYRNLNEVEIVRRLVDEWQRNNSVLGPVFGIATDDVFEQVSYPQREFTMQHNETDAAFIRRLLKRRGIAWCFRPDESERYPKHQLVLMNRFESARQSTAGTVRYHRDAATEGRDAITGWTGVRKLQPRVVTLHSWDYRTPWAPELMQVRLDSDTDQGPSGGDVGAALDDYRVLPPHAGDDPDDLTALGTLAMKRHDFETKCFIGEGSVRDFRAGEYFELTGHPEIDRHPQMEREFVVTELHITAKNNLPRDLAERVAKVFHRSGWANDDLDHRPVRMRFTAVRRGVPLVPAYDPRTDLPPVHMQSAIVVGPANEEVHCDALGRVKIRFPATRAADHQHASNVGASNTDDDSAWVRVASSWAGNGPGHSQCGSLSLPRVGSEVLVAFLGGDPDKPVIVGQMYNERGKPPELSSGGGLPGNRYLSGMRSREVQGGGRGNQLRFDDTKGRIGVQLASDHSDAQLNMGMLTEPLVDGFSETRGDGAELRTDSAIAIRGAGGVLLSAKADSGGPQLSRDDLVGTAEMLKAVAEQLSQLAQTHAEDGSMHGELARLCDRIRQWDGVKAPAAVIAASAPEGMLLASDSNVAVAAQTALDLLSSKDAQVAAGGNVFLRALRGVSIFAHKLGMKLIAASGNVVIQSHNGDIELTATGSVKINAGKGIELQAPEIRLATKGAQVNYGDGKVVQQCKGAYTIKSASFEHTKGGGGSAKEVKFPSTKVETDERVVLFSSHTGKPVAGRRYRLDLPDGSSVEGVTDNEGRTELVTSDAIGDVDITIYPADKQP